MCNRTSCDQMHQLPQSQCGDYWEIIAMIIAHIYIYIYIYIYIKMERQNESTRLYEWSMKRSMENGVYKIHKFA